MSGTACQMQICLRHSLLDRVCMGHTIAVRGLSIAERSGGGRELSPARPRGLPVEFHGDLHAARRVRLAPPVAEVGVLQRGGAAQGAKLHTVQHVKSLPAEVQMFLLLEGNTPREGSVFAEVREITYLGVVPRRRA